MVYPRDFEKKIGFDEILRMLREQCLCGLGLKKADAVLFSSNGEKLFPELKRTDEMRRILLFEEHFPSQDFSDITPDLAHLHIEGTFLEPDVLLNFRLSLITILELISFLKKKKELYPSLYLLTQGIEPDKNIPQRIDRIIDEKASVRNNASPQLARIRKEKSGRLAVIEKKILHQLQLARNSGWTPEKAELTMRNGRLVIPLLSAHKRKINGFILDESATGQTVYLEPVETFEINNEIRELENAERREIIHILTAFADSIRPDLEMLSDAYSFLGEIDFLMAKGKLANMVKASCPKVLSQSTTTLKIRKAVHPLLFLSHTKQKKQVIPLDLDLDPSHRILVISGPNAGGKSVCLKTVGLLQYMFQCGILPSCDESSEFILFGKIFLDIGDEQSLENDLSTYSSKLLNLKFFLENLDPTSLFLIDELGTGTEPSVGGAIAEASMVQFSKSHAYGVITTHYTNLKLLQGKTDGVINGAMLYDSKKMQPLFQLMTGKPGSSFAFEIARNIGFPGKVLKHAATLTGKSQVSFDEYLQNLEVEKQSLDKKSSELRVADDFFNEVISKYQKLYTDLERSKKEILEKAREDALDILNKSNSLIERTIKEIRESQAEKEKTRKAREGIKDFKEKLIPEEKKPDKKEATGAKENKETKKHPGGKREQKTDLPENQTHARNDPYRVYMDSLREKLTGFQLTLDIRGMRVDEALPALQRYLDDAMMLDIHEVKILHGKGNGVLRQITRDYIRSVKAIRSFRDETLEQGGSGITVVQFK